MRRRLRINVYTKLTDVKRLRNPHHSRLMAMTPKLRALTAGRFLSICAACGGAPQNAGEGGRAPSGTPTQINGAGATFPNPIYSKWFDEYNKLHPNVRINYQSVGSG